MAYAEVYTFVSVIELWVRSTVNLKTETLREKCTNMEIFLIGIFPYSVQIQENTDQKKLWMDTSLSLQ